jgi:hypothetical protein
MTKNLALRLSAVALLAIPFGTARASLILSTQILQNGQGFGAVETIFTLQVTGGNQTLGTQIEQGCNAFANPGQVQGAFIQPQAPPGNMCLEGNGNQVANGSPKNALPTLGLVNITNASQIGLLFNMNQVATAGLTINGLNLSFYAPGSTNSIFNAVLPTIGWCNIAALCSGGETFLNSIPGQGGNGQLFVLDAAQQAALTAAITASGAGFANILVGAGGLMGCAGTQTANCKEANDGAESFQLANIGTVVTPEPSSAALMATGLLGLVGVVRRRRRQG